MKLMLLTLVCSLAAEGSILRSGVFAADDEVQLFRVTMQTGGLLSVRSMGYGGDAGLSISPGGFDTVLSLFLDDPSGLLLTYNSDGLCPPVSSDPVSGMCWDAHLEFVLGPGTYVVALTQYDNFATGPMLSDGFRHDGHGNFTPSLSGYPGTAFVDMLGNQRTGNWALLFDGATEVSTVPEPSTLLLVPGGLAVCAARARRRAWF